MQWPGLVGEVRPPNSGLRLYGGAAFERCLEEFQEAALALEFPAGMDVADCVVDWLECIHQP